jgi:hypothetical protein
LDHPLGGSILVELFVPAPRVVDRSDPLEAELVRQAGLVHRDPEIEPMRAKLHGIEIGELDLLADGVELDRGRAY